MATVKDATPMDHFARFESLLASSGGVEAMQKDVTLRRRRIYQSKSRVKAWSSASEEEMGSLCPDPLPRKKATNKNGGFHRETGCRTRVMNKFKKK